MSREGKIHWAQRCGLALLAVSMFAPGTWGLLPDLAGFTCLFFSVRLRLRDSAPPSAASAGGFAAVWVEPLRAAWWSSRQAARVSG